MNPDPRTLRRAGRRAVAGLCLLAASALALAFLPRAGHAADSAKRDARAKASQTAAATASGWPRQPITIVVTFPAGGGTDLLARKLGARMKDALDVPVLVENRPGASGNIGARFVADAKPDGYTLLMVNSSFAINPGVYPRLGFSPANDFKAVINVAWVPSVIVTHPDTSFHSLEDMLAQGRTDPVSVGTCGNGTPQHLAVQMLHEASGAQFQHIPYRGCGPALTDVMTGVVPVGVITLSSAMSHIKSGTLRALAVTAAQRTALLPEVPAVAEAGLAGYELDQWHAVLAPAGVPDDVLDLLSRTLQDVVKEDAVQADLHALGYAPAHQSRDEFQQLMLDDIERFGALTNRMGLRLD